LKLDENIKADLLKNLKQEFLKEREKLEKNRNNAPSEKLNNSRKVTPPKSIQSRASPQKSIPKAPKNIISSIPTQNNQPDNAPLLSESEGNVSNPFINSLDTPISRAQYKPKQLVKKQNDFNSPYNVIYTTSGWGVNNNQQTKIHNIISSNNQTKSNYINTNNSFNNSKISKGNVIKTGNVAVKKLNSKQNYRNPSPHDPVKSKLTQQREENRKNNKNAWIGETENDEDSDEWMVIK
jgi:hypothetical protein